MTQEVNTSVQESVTINSISVYGNRRKPLDCSRPIITDQSHKEMVDINNIMENYVKTGQLPNYSGSPLLYVDDTQTPSFEESHEVLAFARKRFDMLPTALKNELSNDYRKLEPWIQTNPDRAVNLGLLTIREKEKPSEIAALTDALNKNLLKNPPKEGGGAKD